MPPTQKKKVAKKQTQIESSFKRLTEVELFINQSVLVDDSVYGSSPPEDCQGKLFQYTVVEVFESQPRKHLRFKIKFDERCIKEDGYSWDSWKDGNDNSEEIQTMSLNEVKAGHELYMRYLGRVNGRINEEKQRRKDDIQAQVKDVASSVEDIDLYALKNSIQGPVILELEFEFIDFIAYTPKKSRKTVGGEAEPVDAISQFKLWSHKITKEHVKCYPNSRAKGGFDTGPLSTYLRKLVSQNDGSLAYICASHIFSLRNTDIINADDTGDNAPHTTRQWDDEKCLLAQIKAVKALFSAKTPFHFFEDAHFKNFVQFLEPQCKIPDRKKCNKILHVLWNVTLQEIKLIVREAAD